MSKYDELEDFALYRLLRAIKKTIRFLFLLLLLTSISIGVFLFYLQSRPLPNTDISKTTLVYSADGQVIDSIDTGEKRLYVPLSQIPKELIQATLAIEDRKFYEHFGLDPVRIGGAIIADIKQGSKVQGGSTITQQLAKNLYLTHEKTWTRKMKEALLTVQLELKYSKDEILEMYLNQIYYGHGAYGVQLATQTFFGKDKNLSNLTLAESALLAGVPKGPTYYSPFVDAKKAKDRQKIVLQAMVNEGYITQSQMDQAVTDIQSYTFEQKPERLISQAHYFAGYVKKQLINTFHISEEELLTGGYKIYTTLDLEMQEKAEKIIKEKFPDPKKRPLQAALVSIEPETGFIKVMIGGRDTDENIPDQFNRVITAKRQPGSSFKPILYLAALENGITPITQQESVATVFFQESGQEYLVNNFEDKYANREIDLHYAITRSDNIYAVKTAEKIGTDKVIAMSQRLGITSPLTPELALALGASEVSPMEMASAYATIANQGKRIEPTAILKIEDRNGNVLYEKTEIEETQVINPAQAFVMTYMMEGVFEPGGTAASVSSLIKRPVAGKTGTSNDYRDLWLVGYTPQLATAIWTGYDNDQILEKYQGFRKEESHLTKEVWATFMEEAHKGTAPQLFTVPEGVVSLYIDPQTGKLATDHCPSPRLEVFIQGSEPTETCDIHEGNQLVDPKSNPAKKPENQSFWNGWKNWWD